MLNLSKTSRALKQLFKPRNIFNSFFHHSENPKTIYTSLKIPNFGHEPQNSVFRNFYSYNYGQTSKNTAKHSGKFISEHNFRSLPLRYLEYQKAWLEENKFKQAVMVEHISNVDGMGKLKQILENTKSAKFYDKGELRRVMALFYIHIVKRKHLQNLKYGKKILNIKRIEVFLSLPEPEQITKIENFYTQQQITAVLDLPNLMANELHKELKNLPKNMLKILEKDLSNINFEVKDYFKNKKMNNSEKPVDLKSLAKFFEGQNVAYRTHYNEDRYKSETEIEIPILKKVGEVSKIGSFVEDKGLDDLSIIMLAIFSDSVIISRDWYRNWFEKFELFVMKNWESKNFDPDVLLHFSIFMHFSNLVPYFTSTGNWKINREMDEFVVKEKLTKLHVKNHLEVLKQIPKPDFIYVDGTILNSGNHGKAFYKPTFSDYCHGVILVHQNSGGTSDTNSVLDSSDKIYVNDLAIDHSIHEDFYQKHRSYLSYPEKKRMDTMRFYHNLYESTKGVRYRKV